jgi:hypothetical protein
MLATARRPYYDLLFWISFTTLTGLPATTTPIDLAARLADLIGGFQPPRGY